MPRHVRACLRCGARCHTLVTLQFLLLLLLGAAHAVRALLCAGSAVLSDCRSARPGSVQVAAGDRQSASGRRPIRVQRLGHGDGDRPVPSQRHCRVGPNDDHQPAGDQPHAVLTYSQDRRVSTAVAEAETAGHKVGSIEEAGLREATNTISAVAGQSYLATI